jgi:hypothetical protein
LSVHEVATSPTRKDLVYTAYYGGGFRVFSVAGGKFHEVGKFGVSLELVEEAAGGKSGLDDMQGGAVSSHHRDVHATACSAGQGVGDGCRTRLILAG